MKLGLKAIGCHIPDQRLLTLDRIQGTEITEKLVREKTGMLSLARKEKDEGTASLAIKAILDLQRSVNLDLAAIDCLIVVTQNPEKSGLPNTAAYIHKELKLNLSCAAFDISLGCSGYVYGLSVIESFMTANQMKKGILVTADPYSNIVDMTDKNTSLLFGDAATATLIDDDPLFIVGKYDFGTDGRGVDALYVDPNGTLCMNGYAVFNFSARQVPVSIQRVLDKNQLLLSDVDAVVLHQGSRYIVETIAERIGAPEKTPFSCQHYGNTVSSSIPLVLLNDNLLITASNVILAGFGVGLSWASTVITKA